MRSLMRLCGPPVLAHTRLPAACQPHGQTRDLLRRQRPTPAPARRGQWRTNQPQRRRADPNLASGVSSEGSGSSGCTTAVIGARLRRRPARRRCGAATLLCLLLCLLGARPPSPLLNTARVRSALWPPFGPVLVAASSASSASSVPQQEAVTVHLVPHSHCDLGWLDTAEV